ncbi:MAG: mannose-6-phosphate isomerase, class I [Bacteroidota bacterium]
MPKQGIYRLKGTLQHYAWGGTDFIPSLIGTTNADKQPCAELWMGAHQRGPATVQLPTANQALHDFIANDPQQTLGAKVIDAFGESLPYLFKVLDVNKMLSIQAHPTRAAAIAGFADENARGIPLTARHRNYKDDNHKPEVMVALTEFYLLHGFRQIEDIADVLERVPEFVSLQPHFRQQDIKALYRSIMEMPQEDVNTLLEPMKKRLLPQLQAGQLSKDYPDYWAALAFQDYPDWCDRGIFSIYLFNLVRVDAGQGIFQDAGIPHAYLEGVNVELMANSDNVFRGGLTPKHIDVNELLAHLVFEPVVPNILNGTSIATGVRVYKTPAPDFELSAIELEETFTVESTATTPETFIVMEGQLTMHTSETQLAGRQGEVFFVLPGTSYKLSGKARLFRAAVPDETVK